MSASVKHQWAFQPKIMALLIDGLWEYQLHRRPLNLSQIDIEDLAEAFCTKCGLTFEQMLSVNRYRVVQNNPDFKDCTFVQASLKIFDKHYPCKEMKLRNLLG